LLSIRKGASSLLTLLHPAVDLFFFFFFPLQQSESIKTYTSREDPDRGVLIKSQDEMIDVASLYLTNVQLLALTWRVFID
jgi:hypothetical protein